MSAPIFVDPVLDGAADPTVIWNPATQTWWMFYTNRRAHLGGDDAGWIHGSPIGIATSPDGRDWTYRGTVEGLDRPGDPPLNTHWAPEVIAADGVYHMWLTYMPGAPNRFDEVARSIYHFTSPDLSHWTRRAQLSLSSGRVIDAAVARCPDGLWRLWYKDEGDGSSTWVASGSDLDTLSVDHRVIPGRPEAPPHEGPNIFPLSGWWWMIVDEWRGQGVYRSTDCVNWQRQGLILGEPGTDPMDRRYARHADVVPQDGWAALFYFTHPEWDEQAKPVPMTGRERRTTIHVAKVWVEDGVLMADRDIGGVTMTPPAS